MPSIPERAQPLDVPAEDHRCAQSNGSVIDGEWTACHDGLLYGPCTSEYCNGQCECIGDCECVCHGEREA